MLKLDINSLENKILNGDKDIKSANNAKNIIIKNVDKKDCHIFIPHLKHENSVVRSLSRQIIVAKKIEEALPDLEKDFIIISKDLEFSKEKEKDELKFFSEITSIGNTIFALAPKNNYQNKDIENITKKIDDNSVNDKLKATAMKLSCLFDNTLFKKYFVEYKNLSEVEKGSLYKIAMVIENEEKWELYKIGINDKNNQDFIITQLIKDNKGLNFLKDEIANMQNNALLIMLNGIIKSTTNEQDFTIIIPALEKLLERPEKNLLELATKSLMNIYKDNFPKEKYDNILKTSSNTSLVNATSLLLIHFQANDKYLKLKLLDGVKEQEKIENKVIILNHLLQLIREDKEINTQSDENILNYFFQLWEMNYFKEADDLYVIISKIIPHLKIGKSSMLKKCKSRMLAFISKNEKKLQRMVVNNIHESIANFAVSISKLEEEEQKIKDIKILFDIPKEKISEKRLDALDHQLNNITLIDYELQLILSDFLKELFEFNTNNWQIRAKIAKIFKKYNVREDYDFLLSKLKEEESLGVQLNIKETIKELRNKYLIEEKSILIIEPLFYINKLICNFLEKNKENLISIKSFDELKEELIRKKYKLIFIDDSLINEDSLNKIKEIEYDNIVIISSDTKKFENTIIKDNKSNLTLPKPFNEEKIKETVKEYL